MSLYLPVAEHARKAADLIERDGWWDGSQPKPPELNCVLTAFHAIGCSIYVTREFAEWLGLDWDGEYDEKDPLPTWNDTHDAGYVCRMLRKFADEVDPA